MIQELLMYKLKNSAWASSAWCSGALAISNLLRVEIDHVSVDEGVGYGIKALGTNGPMHYVKFHDNNISVVPTGACGTADPLLILHSSSGTWT